MQVDWESEKEVEELMMIFGGESASAMLHVALFHGKFWESGSAGCRWHRARVVLGHGVRAPHTRQLDPRGMTAGGKLKGRGEEEDTAECERQLTQRGAAHKSCLEPICPGLRASSRLRIEMVG